jgi:hypothetical protein
MLVYWLAVLSKQWLGDTNQWFATDAFSSFRTPIHFYRDTFLMKYDFKELRKWRNEEESQCFIHFIEQYRMRKAYEWRDEEKSK